MNLLKILTDKKLINNLELETTPVVNVLSLWKKF